MIVVLDGFEEFRMVFSFFMYSVHDFVVLGGEDGGVEFELEVFVEFGSEAVVELDEVRD